MFSFKNIFNKNSQFGWFTKLSNNERLKQIILIAGKGDIKDFELIQYAILNDPDLGVRMAALKRLSLFKAHPDAKPMLLKMIQDKNTQKLEPYFSMALSQIGIIDIKEFEKRMNGG